jgi:hypothetical protein
MVVLHARLAARAGGRGKGKDELVQRAETRNSSCGKGLCATKFFFRKPY